MLEPVSSRSAARLGSAMFTAVMSRITINCAIRRVNSRKRLFLPSGAWWPVVPCRSPRPRAGFGAVLSPWSSMAVFLSKSDNTVWDSKSDIGVRCQAIRRSGSDVAHELRVALARLELRQQPVGHDGCLDAPQVVRARGNGPGEAPEAVDRLGAVNLR